VAVMIDDAVREQPDDPSTVCVWASLAAEVPPGDRVIVERTGG
jgi:hypothetical protein